MTAGRSRDGFVYLARRSGPGRAGGGIFSAGWRSLTSEREDRFDSTVVGCGQAVDEWWWGAARMGQADRAITPIPCLPLIINSARRDGWWHVFLHL